MVPLVTQTKEATPRKPSATAPTAARPLAQERAGARPVALAAGGEGVAGDRLGSRAATALLLAAVALLHLLQLAAAPLSPSLGALPLALVGGGLLSAAALLWRDSRFGWGLVALLALALTAVELRELALLLPAPGRAPLGPLSLACALATAALAARSLLLPR